MTAFATEFPLKHAHDGTKFLDTIEKWLIGSPHTKLLAEDLKAAQFKDEFAVVKGNERFETLRLVSQIEDATAARYSRVDKDLEWTTTLIYSKQENDCWVGIRVSCESRHPAVRLPSPKKPIIVRNLLSVFNGGTDGQISLSGTPKMLENSDIDFAAGLLTGNIRYHLPIVYVSCDFEEETPVNLDQLASSLAGMAHVLFEPNRPFSLRLKLATNSVNVYGGAIGIYWPDGEGRRSIFLNSEFDTEEELRLAIFEEIRIALTNRLPFSRCTWSRVQASFSQQAFQKLKESGSDELDLYIEEYDKESKALAESLQDANKEIARLRSEVRKYEAKIPVGSGVTLKCGQEQDLYANEISNIIVDALKDAADRVSHNSRRSHILKAIAEENPSNAESDKMREEIKKLLRDYRSLDKRTRRGLEEMGFTLTEEGKHHKAIFRNDERYTFVLPKSGSDWRGGLNAAAEISKILF